MDQALKVIENQLLKPVIAAHGVKLGMMSSVTTAIGSLEPKYDYEVRNHREEADNDNAEPVPAQAPGYGFVSIKGGATPRKAADTRIPGSDSTLTKKSVRVNLGKSQRSFRSNHSSSRINSPREVRSQRSNSKLVQPVVP